MVTSDFRPEVEIRLFHTCAMKNMHYNSYLWPNCQNFHVPRKSGSRNTIVTSDLRAEIHLSIQNIVFEISVIKYCPALCV